MSESEPVFESSPQSYEPPVEIGTAEVASDSIEADEDTSTEVADLTQQIRNSMPSMTIAESDAAADEERNEVPLSQHTTTQESTFIERHPLLGKLARGAMLIAGLAVASPAFGAGDKAPASEKGASGVGTTVIVNGKKVTSVKQSGSKITGATISSDGKTITFLFE
jgi:hypothetical protein